MSLQESAVSQNLNSGLPIPSFSPSFEAFPLKNNSGSQAATQCASLNHKDLSLQIHLFLRKCFHRKANHRSMKETHFSKHFFFCLFAYLTHQCALPFILSIQWEQQKQLSLNVLLVLSKAWTKIRNPLSPLKLLYDIFPENNNICLHFSYSISIKDKEKSDRQLIIQHPPGKVYACHRNAHKLTFMFWAS